MPSKEQENMDGDVLGGDAVRIGPIFGTPQT